MGITFTRKVVLILLVLLSFSIISRAAIADDNPSNSGTNPPGKKNNPSKRSTYVVIGNRVIEFTEFYDSNMVDIPWIHISMFTIILIIILGIVLVKTKYIYFGEKSNHKKI